MNWDEWLYGFAEHAAKKSKDSTKVGAVLVGPEKDVRLCAYNGPPMGVRDYPDRFERPRKYLFASHAEQNLTAFAAREQISMKGCTVYVTHMPCSACARSLIQGGVKEVVFGPNTTSMPQEEFLAARDMFCEAAVKLRGVK